MEEQLKQLNERLTKIERQLGGLSNDTRFQKVIQNAFKTEGINVGKFGLNKTPQGRQADITKPSGGLSPDNECRSAVNDIIDLLDTFGFTA